ncbi:MAG: hypothetical protein HQL27_09200 [Candidatus Omnitrophica bacterium]|nr:hypothetical protein [Candidatus Omnitrophota bacterium]
MRNTLKMHTLIWLFIIFGFAFSPAVEAAERNYPAQFLVEIGKSELKKGKLNDAVHEFSKALMVDPENKEAKKQLEKLGFKEGLYSPSVTTASKLIVAHKALASNQDVIDKALKENEDMKKELLSLKTEREKFLASKMEIIESSKGDAYREIAEQIDRNLTGLNPEKYKEAVLSNLRYEDKLFRMIKKYDSLKADYKRTYAHQDKLISVLEDYLSLREESLNDSADRLVAKEIDLSRQVTELIKQAEVLDAMLNSLMESGSKEGEGQATEDYQIKAKEIKNNLIKMQEEIAFSLAEAQSKKNIHKGLEHKDLFTKEISMLRP